MKIKKAQSDFLRCLQPDATDMKGLIGQRHQASRLNRLFQQEEDHLLFAFHDPLPIGFNNPNRPRREIRGDWQAEFIGTWLNAAVLSAWNQNDQALKKKIDGMVTDLLSTQHKDGYLGGIEEAGRWKSWDIWTQSHVMLGLYSYFQYTGKEEILQAAIRVADRILKDFGPGKRAICETGPGIVFELPDRGCASSSIIEPLIWLYWETGNQQYLDFTRWLVDVDWEDQGGIQLVSGLKAGKGVAGVPYPKGAEMLVCFAGLLDLYRATADRQYLDAVLIAWEDIVHNHLYITGSATTKEFFTKDFVLRNDGVYRLSETCVSALWIYINLSLGRLLGEARFFDLAEQTLYNHLLAAQSPDGHAWAYYVGLRDNKRYRWHIDPECCPSKGTRALALMPQHVFCQDDKGLYVNFYEPAEARLTLNSGIPMKIKTEGNYPFDGNISLSFELEKPSEFGVYLRFPGWCKDFRLKLNGIEINIKVNDKGYLEIKRLWNTGDLLSLTFDMPVKVVVDNAGNNGRIALSRGPLVYAADSSFLPAGSILDDIILHLDKNAFTKDIKVIINEKDRFIHLMVPRLVVKPLLGTPSWQQEKERYYEMAASSETKVIQDLEMVPFFDAGNRDPNNYRDGFSLNDEPVTNISYQVWLPYSS